MAIKNIIKENRVQTNKYQTLIQPGVGSVLFTSIGGLEEELDASELPDRTERSGGRKKPVEFDVTQPMHHDLELLSMEAWYEECQDPVSPLHLKIMTIVIFDQQGFPRRRISLFNTWIKKKVTSDLELEGDGDMGAVIWTLKSDEYIMT